MSRQLTISILVSAFALVSLCLFARADDVLADNQPSPDLLVQAETDPGLLPG